MELIIVVGGMLAASAYCYNEGKTLERLAIWQKSPHPKAAFVYGSSEKAVITLTVAAAAVVFAALRGATLSAKEELLVIGSVAILLFVSPNLVTRLAHKVAMTLAQIPSHGKFSEPELQGLELVRTMPDLWPKKAA